MEHLFDQLQGLNEGLREAILVFDYDGTLAPIVERPELAVLSLNMRKLLKSLAKRFKVAIISGRSLADVKGLVSLRNVYYAGNHGFEISGPRVRLIKPEAKRARPIIAKLCVELRRKLSQVKDVIVEDKGLTASVHYRLVARKELRGLKNIFDEIVKPHVTSGEIRVTHGKKVFEIRPNIEWGKGKAVLWIIDAIDPKKKLKPVYIGDDQTDEDAFFALKNRGVTVLVSKRQKKSHAKFYLKNVGEVKTFLRKLAG